MLTLHFQFLPEIEKIWAESESRVFPSDFIVVEPLYSETQKTTGTHAWCLCIMYLVHAVSLLQASSQLWLYHSAWVDQMYSGFSIPKLYSHATAVVHRN